MFAIVSCCAEKPGWQDIYMSLASSPALKESKLLWERSSSCQKAREMDRCCAAAAAADGLVQIGLLHNSWH